MSSGGGVVIEPVVNTPQILALTMGTFVQRLLGQLNMQRDLPPAPPQVNQYVPPHAGVYFVVATESRALVARLHEEYAGNCLVTVVVLIMMQ